MSPTCTQLRWRNALIALVDCAGRAGEIQPIAWVNANIGPTLNYTQEKYTRAFFISYITTKVDGVFGFPLNVMGYI